MANSRGGNGDLVVERRVVGEIGQTVLYVCPGEHGSAEAHCEPGDVHPALVAQVLNRDAGGLPVYVALALFVPSKPQVEWVKATRGRRNPGQHGPVMRFGTAPTSEAASAPQGETVVYKLDFEPGTFHAIGE